MESSDGACLWPLREGGSTLGSTPSEIQRPKLDFVGFWCFKGYFYVYIDAPMSSECNKKSYKAIMSLESVGFEPLTPFRPIFP